MTKWFKLIEHYNGEQDINSKVVEINSNNNNNNNNNNNTAVALLVSVCLASAVCPLNRWLLERNERKKRRRLELQPGQRRQPSAAGCHYYHQHHQLTRNDLNNNNNKSSTLSSYAGPPPAYEAALRASRLQSLTGASSIHADWLHEALTSKSNQLLHRCPSNADANQLDLGDYFHQPKAELAGNDHCCIPIDTNDLQTGNNKQRQPPVMMRLWVCLLDPADLVARARMSAHNNNSNCGQANANETQETRRSSLSLTRQLSIPQLFDSLINLTSRSASSSAICGQDKEQQAAKAEDKQDEQTKSDNKQQQLQSFNTNEFSSLSSNSTSSTDSQPVECKTDTTTTTTSTSNAPQTTSTTTTTTARRRRRSSSFCSKLTSLSSPLSSITSRVLHMNVASFSYVKDETLISSKKHNQMNFHHFHSSAASAASSSVNANNKKANGKMCQLLVSICDIENLLSSSWLNERACSKLASNSSIYIQCEILCSKSTATRGLLRNPLKALQQTAANAVHLASSPSCTATSTTAPAGPMSSSAPNNDKNTIDFAATLPAAAMEQPPVCPIRLNPSLNELTGDHHSMEQPYSLASNQQEMQTQTTTTTNATTTTNWKHEPNADGKSIVVFQSVPKQIEQQQQLAMDSSQHHSLGQQQLQHSTSDNNLNIIDLIQFDSVFVSPILARSTLDGGHLRLRVYSQCKYVNETCLVELKLPLKQLLKADTVDNLGDARTPRPQHQADLILNNLLANLVTASTGSPLSTLIEQISAEEAEEEAKQVEHRQQASRNELVIDANRLAANKSSSLTQISRFLMSEGNQQEVARGDEEEGGDEEASWHEQCQRLIEQNYCRSMLVSHWLNYLVAPSYECQLVEETRGKLLLGLTYLPTSNRLIFNAHRATIELDRLNAADKQLVKKLRLQSDTLYLVRFMMLANGRVLKRKQSTLAAKKPEWDSQEAITFDLVNVSVDQPSFLISFVMRNGQTTRTSSARTNRTNHQLQFNSNTNNNGNQLAAKDNWPPTMISSFSEPESLRSCSGVGQQTRSFSRHHHHQQQQQQSRDFVVGHLVLADEVWNELKAQPRRQIVKQFKLM